MVRFSIFIAAAAIIGLGVIGMNQLDKDNGMAFLLGALTLGGGFLICGLFSLKMQWHGIVGAGVLALLGLGRGILNLPGIAQFFSGDRPRGSAPAFELATLIICAYLLLRIWQAWTRELIRRRMEEPFEE
ncbi:MAG: hypothetical protein IZT59_00290 [Verrucomicrobia bacterium]|jgi:hypothetical protein|nr:hypothetical protein [Verrucomicrobiota bacterium]|tara:strand:+ start:11287 stop:11676 length:390 start_codon:yes stop_codon:yes gene_type:complete